MSPGAGERARERDRERERERKPHVYARSISCCAVIKMRGRRHKKDEREFISGGNAIANGESSFMIHRSS